MTQIELPEWLPPAVHHLIRGLHAGGETRLNRFLTNERMKRVWRRLEKHSVEPGGIKKVDPDQLLASLDIGPQNSFDEHQQACAAFTWAVMMTTSRTYKGEPVVPTTNSLKKIAEPFDILADRCEWLRNNDVMYPMKVPPDIADAAEKVAAYCKKSSAFIKQDGSPYVLDRSSGQRGEDDAMRSYIRGIAVASKRIWGEYMHGTLTTIAEVLFDRPANSIKDGTVEGWCRNLPP